MYNHEHYERIISNFYEKHPDAKKPFQVYSSKDFVPSTVHISESGNSFRSSFTREVRAHLVSSEKMYTAAIINAVRGELVLTGCIDAIDVILINGDIVIPAIAEYIERHRNELIPNVGGGDTDTTRA